MLQSSACPRSAGMWPLGSTKEAASLPSVGLRKRLPAMIRRCPLSRRSLHPGTTKGRPAPTWGAKRSAAHRHQCDVEELAARSTVAWFNKALAEEQLGRPRERGAFLRAFCRYRARPDACRRSKSAWHAASPDCRDRGESRRLRRRGWRERLLDSASLQMRRLSVRFLWWIALAQRCRIQVRTINGDPFPPCGWGYRAGCVARRVR